MELRLRRDVSTTDTEYGAVLLDERNGHYWQLNPTGALAVRLLLAGHDLAHTAGVLAAEFDVPETEAAEDVTALITELRSAELVEPAP
ncbi:MAG TPA: lasso peptide biosynthesis PqqD family chaperone [Micromonosporaceae bacterium]|nr:lasso peptide biosynthesis PqqD family chaperone [Micromonosporaceae bacterium]